MVCPMRAARLSPRCRGSTRVDARQRGNRRHVEVPDEASGPENRGHAAVTGWARH